MAGLKDFAEGRRCPVFTAENLPGRGRLAAARFHGDALGEEGRRKSQAIA